MDETGKRLIRESFPQISALAAPAAILFYGRAFRLDPSLRPVLARSDMRAQGSRFIAMLGYAVAMLDRPDRLLPAARELVGRLGLRPEHHAALGAALEWMLEECLAEDFSEELRAAWSRAFRLVTETLTEEVVPALAA